MLQVTKPLGFIERHGLWTDEQRRQAEELKRRVEKDKLQLVRLAWADPHGASRAKAVTVPAFLAALDERLQHQRRDHDARFRQRAHLRVVHARRRHGPRRDDRLAQPHHRARSRDLPRAAVGARRRLGAVRRIFQQRRAVSLLAAPAAAQAARAAGRARAWAASSAWRSSGTCCASREDHLGDEHIGVPGRARAADQDLAGRARLLLSLRIQHGPDAAGAVGAGRGVRDSSACRCARSRTSGGPGQVECTFAARAGARGRRQRAAVPHRDAADLPPHGLLRDLHVPARRSRATIRAAGICISRWSTRKTGRNLFMPERERRAASRRSAATSSAGCCSTPSPATAFATPTVNGYRRYRPNSLAPDRATWGYDHRGVMIRVLGGAGRSGDAAGEPRSASRPPTRISTSRRRSSPASTASSTSSIPGRRTTSPTRPTGRCCRRACRRRSTRSSRSRCSASSSATCSSTISSSSSATRPAGSAQWLEDAGGDAGDEPTEWEQNEYFDFF